MRFTEYVSEATPEEPTTRSWVDPQPERPDYSKFNAPAWKRKPDPKAHAQDPNDAAWEELKKAATDPTTGRELITLLGAMYQAKRTNPNVVMSIPKMVTTLPDNQTELKKQMTALFNIAKNDDVAHLAARSQELQQARMDAVAKPGTKPTPGQQPVGQVKTSTATTTKTPTTNTSVTQSRGAMLQQLLKLINDTVPKLTTRQIKQASAALNAPINAKRRNRKTKVPASTAMPGQPPMTTGATG